MHFGCTRGLCLTAFVMPAWIVMLMILAVSGCATYSSSFAVIESQLHARQFDAALKTMDQQGYAARDEVLYLLNKGMVQRMNGDYEASNISFEAAKMQMDVLAATSVSETTLTFVINDGTQSYIGEEHEQVLVHLYKAFNYLELHQLDAARVEAQQVDLLLREFSSRFSGTRFSEAAFARYLTGMIYEELEEWSNALIAYRKAYEAYQQATGNSAVPHVLRSDLLRLTKQQGLIDEHDKYSQEFGVTSWTELAELREQGEVIFILHNGLAPIKRESSTTVPDPRNNHIIRISLPYYESRPVVATGARVNAWTQVSADKPEDLMMVSSTTTQLVENIDAIAQANLAAKLPAITARALARVATKRAISKAAQDAARSSNNDTNALVALILGFGVEATTLLTEVADTRSWLTLPHDIQLARLPLPPGDYLIRVEFLGFGNQVIGSREYPVHVERGRKYYFSYHYIAAGHAETWR